jgi:hypothetical protein
MQAVVQEELGSPNALTVQQVEKPTPGDAEVLVRVRAASVHPDVWHVVCGRPYVLRLMGTGYSKPKNPIPGTDMAGVVEAVGKNVTEFRLGDRPDEPSGGDASASRARGVRWACGPPHAALERVAQRAKRFQRPRVWGRNAFSLRRLPEVSQGGVQDGS